MESTLKLVARKLKTIETESSLENSSDIQEVAVENLELTEPQETSNNDEDFLSSLMEDVGKEKSEMQINNQTKRS